MPSPPRAKKPITEAPPKIALVLQGGGALGAYQVGAFEALHNAGFTPDWLAGISIGAFNAAIIAGNEPSQRLEKLTGFWQNISWPDLPGIPPYLPLKILHNQFSNGEALTIGQPNFFSPRLVSPYFLNHSTPDALSFYDTSALRQTLLHFTSFERINQKTTRLAVGATNISTGDLQFFDNHATAITPDHVIASGSLPPGFPATAIVGTYFWDGGCVSNTPLEAIAAAQGPEHLLVFVIDLWQAAGAPPQTMSDVFWRAKQIQYASRTGRDLKLVATAANHAHAVSIAQSAGLPEMAGLPDKPAMTQGPLDLVHITYHPDKSQTPNSDAEFSRLSLAARRQSGKQDMEKALSLAPWTQPMPPHQRARIHQV